MIDGISDSELLQRVRARDKTALATLYDRHAGQAFSLAVYVLGSAENAEEVLQDVFLSVWDRPEAWDPTRGAFATWLLAVTRYRAIDRLRGREQRRRTHEISLELTDDAEEWLAAGDDIGRDDGRLLQGLVARLPREQADLIELAYYKGMTHSGIAAATGIPLGTVKTRLRLGLQTLRTLWLQETEVVDDV